jgi:hypothetical protein
VISVRASSPEPYSPAQNAWIWRAAFPFIAP